MSGFAGATPSSAICRRFATGVAAFCCLMAFSAFLALLMPTSVRAQGMADVASGLRTDPDSPIEIEADQLDIYDKKKIAVFKGRVVATQGETTLHTSSLTIHYTGGGVGTAQSITRLEASGGVRVTQKDQEARGDTAFVDMAGEMITMIGNVVLKQGENVLRGSKLGIDMKSGAARLIASPSNGGHSLRPGRVQGVFIPNRQPQK